VWIYPDAWHGFVGHYPVEFAEHVNTFLDGG
jgi:hypothetical protein